MLLMANYQKTGMPELPTYEVGSSQASRVSSKEVIQELSKAIPSFWGGSSGLVRFQNTMVAADKDFTPKHDP